MMFVTLVYVVYSSTLFSGEIDIFTNLEKSLSLSLMDPGTLKAKL
jgi:hypothetical protein